MDLELMLFCVLHHTVMQRHTSHLENKRGGGEAYQWGSRGWLGGRSLHTTRSIAQIFVGVVFNASSHLHDFCCGSDCMSLGRLNYFMNAVACRPVTPRLWSGFFVWLVL